MRNMTRGFVVVVSLLLTWLVPAGGTTHAQALPATQALPGAPTAPPVVSSPPVSPTPLYPPLPADRPERLMAAQQLALTAYPELRARGLQLRVEESVAGPTVTIGFAARDRDTVLAVSRPREAQLVIEATFDPQNALTQALLRGTLAHTKERRDLKALTIGLADALDAQGAAFGPANRAALLQQLDLPSLRPLLGALTVQTAEFHQDATDDGVFWQVAATGAGGESLTLGFEPYAGRLVRVSRGAAQ
jgi:hypothetical protein